MIQTGSPMTQGDLRRVSEAARRVLLGMPVRTVTTSSALSPVSDYFVSGDTSSAGLTLTLPLASEQPGKMFVVKKAAAANTLTIAASGSDTIDGAATLAWTTQYQAYLLISTGTTWSII